MMRTLSTLCMAALLLASSAEANNLRGLAVDTNGKYMKTIESMWDPCGQERRKRWGVSVCVSLLVI
jgi:hypothetical protein